MSRIFAVACALVLASCAVQAAVKFPAELPPLREGPNNRLALPDAGEVKYRLPNNTRPLAYNVDITTNIHEEKFEFNGKVDITLEALQDTPSITLHQRQLKNIVGVLTDKAVNKQYPLKSEYDSVTEFLTFTPTGLTLKRGQQYVLSITYEGVLREDNGGFYRSSYKLASGKDEYLATTQFESTDARHAFPCFDEPAKRAVFTITIRHGANYHAVSNMPIDAAKSIPTVSVFQPTKEMSTYLVAFIVSKFVSTSGQLGKVQQRVFSRASTGNQQDYALIHGIQILDKLEKYFGIDFALPKIDQFAIPDFAAGAMENWGLATYREEYSLCDAEKCSTANKNNIANIVAHEYTHQWFGNLVSIAWWQYLWLKESFATIFSYKAVEEVHPEWDVFQIFTTDEYQRALNSDGGLNPRPMTYYVEQPRQIGSLYDSISYSKGGAVLRMFEHAYGKKVFQRGLYNYLNNRKFNSGIDSDLFTAIANAAKELNVPMVIPVEEGLGSWTNQGGHPLLVVTRNYTDGTFVVHQEPFYNDENAKKDGRSWHVPYNFISKSNGEFADTAPHAWLMKEHHVKVTPKPDSAVAADDWLLLNKQSTGYYRINYDAKNWALLIAALKDKHYKIHTLNRAALIYDSYRFSVSNRLSHALSLELLTYLKNEEEYAPWSSAYSVFAAYNRYLTGSPKEHAIFQKFLHQLVSNLFDKLGTVDDPAEAHLTKYVRNIGINLACMAGTAECLQKTHDLVAKENKVPINANIQSAVYCNGLKNSTNVEFNRIYSTLMKSTDQSFRRVLISALGCDQQRSHLEKFINSTISTSSSVTLRVQERTTILSSAYSRGEEGLYASIAFLEDNYDAYSNLNAAFGGGSHLNSDIHNMANYVTNDEHHSRLLKLIRKINNHPAISKDAEANVNNTVQANFDWLKTNKKPLAEWMEEYNTSGAAQLVASILPLFVAFIFSRGLMA